jgi:hypothetical protein
MNTEKEILKHEKALGVLDMIKQLNRRILRSSDNVFTHPDFGNLGKHYDERIEIDTKMKERLTNYYHNL